jgi:hypothetical protein
LISKVDNPIDKIRSHSFENALPIVSSNIAKQILLREEDKAEPYAIDDVNDKNRIEFSREVDIGIIE